MNITQRNFFRLLRAGAFGQQEQVEPMSAWKWRQVLRWALPQGVAPLLCDGLDACGSQFFLQLPPDLQAEWHDHAAQAAAHHGAARADVSQLLALLSEQQLRPILTEPWSLSTLYEAPGRQQADRVAVYFPYATQGAKADEWARQNGTGVEGPAHHVLTYQWRSLRVEHRHRLQQLSSKIGNVALQHIIEQERMESTPAYITLEGRLTETVPYTLAMLTELLAVFKAMLANSLRLSSVVDIGVQLRRQGHQVDYVKLQGWLERLHFERMALLVGHMLTQLLGFSADEVPFVQVDEDRPVERLADLFCQDVPASSRYFRYCPGESIATLFASITRSLEKVEE